MFKRIILIYDSCKAKFLFELVDTDFAISLDDFAVYGLNDHINIVNVIISEYSQRNLNVAKNIALYYLYLNKCYSHQYNIKQLIAYHRNYFDTFQPKLGFSKKYYHCTLNQLKQLTYGKPLNGK